MSSPANDKEICQRLGHLEALLGDLEQVADPAAQDKMRDVVQTLLEFHGAALARILEKLSESGESGRAMIDAVAQDELASSLLLLHGLHPLDLNARVTQALDKVRPYLASHGGHVELLEITPEAVIRLRLEGSCHGCPSSRVTLQNTMEEAIWAVAPDVTAIEVEGLAEEVPPTPPSAVADSPVGFVPLSQVTLNHSPIHAAVGG